MTAIVAFLLAATVSKDAAVYGAVVRSIRHDFSSIPRVRVFVLDRTIAVSQRRIDELARATPRDDGGQQWLQEIRKHSAYAGMIAIADVVTPVPPMTGATLVRRPPRKLSCEGMNWELSRDLVLELGVPGYSHDGTEAVVFYTIRDCISGGNLVCLLRRDGNGWKVEKEACLSCWGE